MTPIDLQPGTVVKYATGETFVISQDLGGGELELTNQRTGQKIKEATDEVRRRIGSGMSKKSPPKP